MLKLYCNSCLLAGSFVVALSLSLPGAAQNPPAPAAPAASSNASANDQQDQSLGTLKVNVDVVQLFFNVKDKHGALIPNLTKDNFDLFEDGQPQTIKYFKAESDLPLTLGMLIDSSGSQMRVLDMEKEVGASFLESTLRPKDEAFVIAFDVDITLLQDFTNSVSRLRHALNEAKINTGGVGCSGGPIGPQGPIPCGSSGPRGTALYDAVYLASHDEFSHEVGRKAMILLTDGEDEGSRLKIKDAIEAAQKADAICYVLLIADRGFYGGMGYHGDSEMKNSPRKPAAASSKSATRSTNSASLRPDFPGTPQPVQHRLRAHQHRARRIVPQSRDQAETGRLQDTGPQRVLRHRTPRRVTTAEGLVT